MITQMGEYVVGAYLKLILGCDFVDFNIRPPGGGLRGLGELDVIGLDFAGSTAYLCEVTTHLGGLAYSGGYDESVRRVKKKYLRQREYAEENLGNFDHKRFMFWSPRVPVGALTEQLEQIEGLELVINEVYTQKVRELQEEAGKTIRDAGNPFFRALQILEHLR